MIIGFGDSVKLYWNNEGTTVSNQSCRLGWTVGTGSGNNQGTVGRLQMTAAATDRGYVQASSVSLPLPESYGADYSATLERVGRSSVVPNVGWNLYGQRPWTSMISSIWAMI